MKRAPIIGIINVQSSEDREAVEPDRNTCRSSTSGLRPEPDWSHGRFWPGVLALLCLLAGCSRDSSHSGGVELVMSSSEPTPGMTFELRFDWPIVKGDEVGLVANNSP